MNKFKNSNFPTSGYVYSLDGLRALSILVVIFSHLGYGHIIPGGFGVTVFFFISGFLITRLLLLESIDNFNISLKNFYIRRFIRLMPALVFYMMASVVFLFFIEVDVYISDILSVIFYFANYYKLYVGYPSIESLAPNSVVFHPFSILWSLSIEEQFYIAFPILLVVLRRRISLLFNLLLLLCFFALIFRVLYFSFFYFGSDVIYYSTETRFDIIMFGCIFSLYYYLYAGQVFFSRFLLSYSSFILGVGILVICFLVRDDFFRATLRYSLQGVGLCLMLPSILFGEGLLLIKKFLNSSVLVYIGRLSYTLYLFHWLSITISTYYFSAGSLVWFFFVVVLTVCLSVFSYHLIELPILKLKKRYNSVGSSGS